MNGSTLDYNGHRRTVDQMDFTLPLPWKCSLYLGFVVQDRSVHYFQIEADRPTGPSAVSWEQWDNSYREGQKTTPTEAAFYFIDLGL